MFKLETPPPTPPLEGRGVKPPPTPPKEGSSCAVIPRQNCWCPCCLVVLMSENSWCPIVLMSKTEGRNGGVRALLCGIHDVVTRCEKGRFVVGDRNKFEINVRKIWNLALFFVSLHHGTEDQQRARSGRPLTAIKKHTIKQRAIKSTTTPSRTIIIIQVSLVLIIW